MSDDHDATEKTHFICQTYTQNQGAKGGQAGLKVDKLFQYTTQAEAKNRAERESQSDRCAGADAYMIVEDTNSGEVSPPMFLARFGTVPDTDDF
jgi:hypothetical protein